MANVSAEAMFKVKKKEWDALIEKSELRNNMIKLEHWEDARTYTSDCALIFAACIIAEAIRASLEE